MLPFKVNFKVWRKADNQSVFGKGKAVLLRHIKDSGSINKAAKNMNISNRKACRLTHKIPERFSESILVMKKGGVKGGWTHLTSYAEELLDRFEKLEQQIQEFTKKTAKDIFHSE